MFSLHRPIGNMAIAEVTLGLAFVAGLASFLSPCVLSLVPVYIGYLGGQVFSDAEVQFQISRRRTFLHGLAFVLGFSIVFVTLGAAASTIGQALYDIRGILTRVGGLVVIIFGLHVMGVIAIPFLYYDTRRQVDTSGQGLNFFSSVLTGIFFSAGWSPCVGPVLGAMLTLAFSSEGVNRGVYMLSAYSLGLAIPFLAAALAVGQMTRLIRRLGKVRRAIEIANGLLLLLIGGLLFSGALGLFTARFAQSPGLLELQQMIDSSVVDFWQSIVSGPSG